VHDFWVCPLNGDGDRVVMWPAQRDRKKSSMVESTKVVIVKVLC
jgi:hypothetical protein